MTSVTELLFELETIKEYFNRGTTSQISDASWISSKRISQNEADFFLKEAFLRLDKLIEDIRN